MTKKSKPCPQSVIEAGALLVKCRLDAEALARNLIRARGKVIDASAEIVAGGALEMESGEALDKLMDAARAPGLIGAAHNSLRAVLAANGYAQPTNEQIVKAWPIEPPSVRRGGGGGRGR